VRFLFKNDDLRKLYVDGVGGKNYSQEVVTAFFRVIGVIKNAVDERDLRKLKSLHYEQLKGKRHHQHSLRLNRQWRLIVERQQDAEGRLLWVIDIEDYH
jgi:toxin HigB-1